MIDFKTPKGNNYALDSQTGLIIPYSPTMKALIKLLKLKQLSKEDTIKQLNNTFEEKDISFCYDWLKKWEKFRYENYGDSIPSKVNKLNQIDIKNYLLQSGFKQMTLCITEDCNFRCKYCVYSDSYEETRNHSTNYMDFKTAKKAIDNYLSLLEMGERYNPLRMPVIGFYGGEPLLNFKLIKDCVSYMESLGKKLETQFHITTNGSLLDKKKAEWLMQNDFMISISLDGPEEEHNRLRVYSDGSGTFKDIMKNISVIMDKNYDKIFAIPVFDWKSDLFKIEEFFNRKDVPHVLTVSNVDDATKTKYYEQFTEKDYQNFMEQFKLARKYYFNNIEYYNKNRKDSFFDSLIGRTPGDELFDCEIMAPKLPVMPFTGSCVPGRKIFVNIKGDYHMCERVPEKFPIGNVNEGLSFERIARIVNEYLYYMDKCPECKIEKKCNKCFKHFISGNKFLHSSIICENIESNTKNTMSNVFDIAEIHSEFVDKANVRHVNIKKYYG